MFLEFNVMRLTDKETHFKRDLILIKIEIRIEKR